MTERGDDFTAIDNSVVDMIKKDVLKLIRIMLLLWSWKIVMKLFVFLLCRELVG